MREMKRGGLGGFFMHNRIGLVTPYMGKRWIECIGATVDEARELGMKAWLYDEDRWPSGFGGGLVVKSDPDFGAKYLELTPNDKPREYRFAVTKEGEAVSYRRLAKGQGRARARNCSSSRRRLACRYPGSTTAPMPTT